MSFLPISNELIFEVASFLNTNDLTSLSYANSHFEWLLEDRIGKFISSDEVDGQPAVCWAANHEYVHLELLKLVLGRGADMNALDEWGNNGLRLAVRNNNQKDVEFLLSNGADADMIYRCGDTNLMISVTKGNAAISNLLLSNGARVHLSPDKRRTEVFPLLTRVVFQTPSNIHLLLLLIRNGARIEQKGRSGNTALHIAVETGRHRIVLALLDAGAEVDTQDKEWNTALHKAISDIAMLKILLRYGAKGSVRNFLGRTAFDEATRFGLKYSAAVKTLGGCGMD